MLLSIRNQEAEAIAERLARLDDTTVDGAVVVALDEAIAARLKSEPPSETARKILARRGLSLAEGRRPVSPEAYHDLDHDLTGRG